MKIFAFFCLTVLASLLYPPQTTFSQKTSVQAGYPAARPTRMTEATLADRDVYYFIETECEGCSPGAGLPAGKYWVITRGIALDTYETHNDAMERFRHTLQTKYGRKGPLLDALTFRFQFTRAEAEQTRQEAIEARQKAGYTVVELEVEQ